MAARRRGGYGTAPIPKQGGRPFPLPPPPDGKPPVRLPVGGDPMGQAPAEDMTGQSDQEMMRLLQLLGGRPDQM